jgi:hypothetical protein
LLTTQKRRTSISKPPTCFNHTIINGWLIWLSFSLWLFVSLICEAYLTKTTLSLNSIRYNSKISLQVLNQTKNCQTFMTSFWT